MALPKINRYVPLDASANRFVDSVERFADQISQIPFLDGNLIEDIEIVSGTEKVIDNLLGRDFKGYIIVKKTANATVWASSSSVSGTIGLNASANVTISLWVF